MLSQLPLVQVSDTRDDDSSNAADPIISTWIKLVARKNYDITRVATIVFCLRRSFDQQIPIEQCV